MSRSGSFDVAVKLEGSGGADPGVMGVWGGLPDDQLGRNFLFFLCVNKISNFA